MKYFRIIFGLGIALFMSLTAKADDIPQLINFQAVLDSAGTPLANKTKSVEFKIYDAAVAGTVLWSETQSVTTDAGGVFNVLLGSSTPIPDTAFQGTVRYLGIKITTEVSEMTPRQRLVSTPYSYEFDETGPDSVVSAYGTAFLGKVAGSSSSPIYGISGSAANASTGKAYGVYGNASGSSSDTTFGYYGSATNSSSGDVYGGYFDASSPGTGRNRGVRGTAYGSTSLPAYGSYGWAGNTSSGDAYGGFFRTDSVGTGFYHFGTNSRGYAMSSGIAAGVYGFGDNTSTGDAYGGFFETSSRGTGWKVGILANASGSSSFETYGSRCDAENTSTGDAYGGYFYTFNSGTGVHYGVYGDGSGSSSASTFGFYGHAINTSTGPAYGSFCVGSNTSTGSVFGGVFQATSSGTGTHYGVYGVASGSSSAIHYGCYGTASNTSTGVTYAGYFDAPASGTGAHYGVYGQELAGGSGAAVYAAGDFIASGTKSAVLKTSQGNKLFYAVESPEVWFEDFGAGRLNNGRAHIELDPTFLETVGINASNPMKVFVQLTSGNPVNVVVNKGTTGFDVVVADNASNSTFDYRIVAKRKGYETERLRATTVGAEDPNLHPELWEKIEKEQQERQAQMELGKGTLSEEPKPMGLDRSKLPEIAKPAEN